MYPETSIITFFLIIIQALVDWKSKTKSKAAKIKKEIGKTGGGPGEYAPLSDLENRLIQIMGKRAVDGDEVPEMGFGKVFFNKMFGNLSFSNLLYSR